MAESLVQRVAERLHLEDVRVGGQPVVQRRADAAVIHHPEIGVPRGAHCVGHEIAERRFVRRWKILGDRRDVLTGARCDGVDRGAHVARHSRVGSDRIGKDVADLVLRRTRTVQGNIDHIDGRTVRIRLYDRYAVDHRVDERVRVAGDDGVDVLLERTHHVEDLAVARSGSVGVAESTGVGEDDDGVRAAAAKVGREAVDDRRGVVEAEPGDDAGLGRGLGGSRDDADDADRERAARDDRVVADPRNVASVGEAHVGGEDVVVLVAHPRAERVGPPIELVVAQRRGGIPQTIVDPGYWAAVGEIRRQRPLELVAAVYQDPLTVGRRALGFRALDRRGERRGATAQHAARVATGLQRAVKIVRSDDSQARGRGAL